MAFDPTLPLENTETDAVQMRNQLNGLKDLIDAIPAGPEGPPGPQGPPFAAAMVDSVATLPSYEVATVTSYYDGTYVRFTFGIPQGVPGEVSLVQLNDAISFTSANSNGVATLTEPSPTVEELAAKLNELITALRR